MTFRQLQGQPAALMVLGRMLQNQRVPGSLLFLGPHHVGKRTAALALAQALNCAAPVKAEGLGDAKDGCGVCPSCRQIAAASHPDVEVVEPDGQFIKIDQVRGLGDWMALHPLLARRRVGIMREAERMNPQAANAFLKTLEEPPADTVLVLCAAEARQLPETIVSRCVPVRFAPLPAAVVRALLGEPAQRLDPSAAHRAAPPLQGPALDFAVRFAKGQLRPELRERSAEWVALREELLSAWAELLGGNLSGWGERLARWSGPEQLPFVLEWLEDWFRDVALLGAAAPPEAMINGDRLDALRPWPARLPPRKAERCYRRVLATRDALALNANKALALEALWLDFKQVLGAG